jgi:hypothetical protein
VLADCFITQVNGRNKLITLLMPISEIQDTKLREEDKVKSRNISFCKKKKIIVFSSQLGSIPLNFCLMSVLMSGPLAVICDPSFTTNRAAM